MKRKYQNIEVEDFSHSSRILSLPHENVSFLWLVISGRFIHFIYRVKFYKIILPLQDSSFLYCFEEDCRKVNMFCVKQ